MTQPQTKTWDRLVLACVLGVLMILSSYPNAVLADSYRARRITVEPLGFQIDVPAYWQLTLNERLRGEAFLRIRGTTHDGRIIPATLSIIYTTPEEGTSFPQLPDPELYAELMRPHLEGIAPDAELIRAEVYEIDGHAGVIVEYRHTVEGHILRTAQINVVPPSGTYRYHVTYATFEEHVDVDFPYLEEIVGTIELNQQDFEEDQE